MAEPRVPEAELAHLSGEVYLDYAGAGVYCQSQVNAYAAELLKGGYGNPHSLNEQGARSRSAVESLRERVLSAFNVTDREYTVVLTAGTTSGLKTVAHGFRWSRGSVYAVHEFCHNSVLGIRGVSTAAGAGYRCVPKEAFPPAGPGRLGGAGSGPGAGLRSSSGGGLPEPAAELPAGGGLGPGELSGNGDSTAGLVSGELSGNGVSTGPGELSVSGALTTGLESGELSGNGVSTGPGELSVNGVLTTGLESGELSGNGVSTGPGELCVDGVPTEELGGCLLAAPLVCNFSGLVVPLAWCGASRENGWCTLVDAACAFGKRAIDLSDPACQPDFLVFSFYKAFGFPTGLGCLLVRKGSEAFLRKEYFGGGTVEAVTAGGGWCVLKKDTAASLEDGTPSFLDAVAALVGIEHVQRTFGGWPEVQRIVDSAAEYLAASLTSLRHAAGGPVVRVYGRERCGDRHCGIVSFSVVGSDGALVGHAVVVEAAAASGVNLRGGCFCNPGACHRYLRISPDDARRHREAGHVCGDSLDIIDGKPTGAVRSSVGVYTTRRDIDSLCEFLRACFVHSADGRVDGSDRPHRVPYPVAGGVAGRIESMYLYPVKGARPLRVCGPWPVCRSGFFLDRAWCVVRAGVAVTRKQAPRMADLQPFVDFADQALVLCDVHRPDDPLRIPLPDALQLAAGTNTSARVNVRGTAREVWPVTGEDSSRWFLEHLGDARLRVCVVKPAPSGGAGSLANTGSFLLVNRASVAELARHVGCPVGTLPFRPNLVISPPADSAPWTEDTWDELRIGGDGGSSSADLLLSQFEPCVRCSQVNFNGSDHEPAPTHEPLRTLLRMRGNKGKALFGVTATPACPVLSDEATAALLADAKARAPAGVDVAEVLAGRQPGFDSQTLPSLRPGSVCTVTKTRDPAPLL
ncbi:Molybdenum cofactor sulfurase [Diplonema papillatum]|nr:Molybdenum cofactor sulfurase [Diplonema papillatum]